MNDKDVLDIINTVFKTVADTANFKEYSPFYVRTSDMPSLTTNFTTVVFPVISKVVFNDPATIVWFSDGTKVIVKKSESDTYSKEHALLYAIAKRLYGKVDYDGNVASNGFMTFLKKTVQNGIDQPELARKAAAEKKAKKKAVSTNVQKPKTDKKVVTTDSSTTNVSKQKYYAKKSNTSKK